MVQASNIHIFQLSQPKLSRRQVENREWSDVGRFRVVKEPKIRVEISRSLYFSYLCRKEICPLNLDVFYYQIIKGFVLVRFVMLGCKM